MNVQIVKVYKWEDRGYRLSKTSQSPKKRRSKKTEGKSVAKKEPEERFAVFYDPGKAMRLLEAADEKISYDAIVDWPSELNVKKEPKKALSLFKLEGGISIVSNSYSSQLIILYSVKNTEDKNEEDYLFHFLNKDAAEKIAYGLSENHTMEQTHWVCSKMNYNGNQIELERLKEGSPIHIMPNDLSVMEVVIKIDDR